MMTIKLKTELQRKAISGGTWAFALPEDGCPLGYGWYTLFNSQGKLISIKDPRGNSVTLQYTSEGYLSSITDIMGRQVLTFTNTAQGRISTITDIAGRTVKYEYDELGNMTKTTLPSDETTPVTHTYTYNQNHGLTSKTNPIGETYTIEYYSKWLDKGIVYRIIDPEGTKAINKGAEPTGHVYTLIYDFINKIFKYTDYNGVTYVATVNQKGEVTSVSEQTTDSTTPVTKTEYLDSIGRNVKVTDAAGNTTITYKDEWGNIKKKTDGEGNDWSYTYNTQNKLLISTDPLGTITKYEYDQYGNRTKETQAAGTEDESITAYTYNEYNELTSTTTDDAITSFTYDNAGNMTQTTYPMSKTTTLAYDNAGNLLSITDPTNNKTEFTYDDRGNRLTQKDPEGNTTTYTYNGANRMTSTTDPNGNTTTYEYDYKGRITVTKDPMNNRKEYQYDGNGNQTKITEGDSTTTMTYDSSNRVTSVTDGEGNTTRYYYATSGTASCGCSGGGTSTSSPAKIADPLNNETIYTFDKNGRTTATKDPMGGITAYIYNAVGKVMSKTDANGNITKYQYNRLGRLIKQTDALGGAISYTYDKRGNLLTVTDTNGNTTRYEYDHANRKTKEIRPMGQTTEYSYDSVGNIKTKKNAKGQVTVYNYSKRSQPTEIIYADENKETLTYDKNGNMTGYTGDGISGIITYDKFNRKITETASFGAFQKSYSYSFDNKGNKSGFTSPENTVYSYSYNKNNQLSKVTFGANVINYNYQWKRLTKAAFPNGFTTDYIYNPNGWLTTIKAALGNNAVMEYQYAFDKTGNINTKTTEHGTYNYVYDKLYRLTQASNPSLPQETYTYDRSGNRLTSQEADNWTYNANDELISYNDISLSYDANGNTIQKSKNSQLTKYIYDAKERLQKVELPDGKIATYIYDPFGRRIKKQVGDEIIYFLYSDEGLIGEYDVNGNILKAYGWKPISIWGTNPLFVREGNNYYYYQNDHLGTPQKLTDSTGNIVWSAKYTAFGKATIETMSTVTNDLRFPGQYYDVETGLHQNYNRDYDTGTGRYIEVDPIGIAQGENHLYVYVENKPLHYADPEGLGIIACIKCGYWMNHCQIDAKWCKQRMQRQKRKCDDIPPTPTDLANECFVKMPSCQKMRENCGKCMLTTKL